MLSKIVSVFMAIGVFWLADGAEDKKSINSVDCGVDKVTEDHKEKMEIFYLIVLEVKICLRERMLQQIMKLTVQQLCEDGYVLLAWTVYIRR